MRICESSFTGSVGCQCPINSKIVVFVDVFFQFFLLTHVGSFLPDPVIAGFLHRPRGPEGGGGSDVSILMLTNFFLRWVHEGGVLMVGVCRRVCVT